MKAVVVYRSKAGFTKQYAEWIAEELNADLLDATRAKLEQLTPYDTIIYGGGLYAMGINGVKLIKNNLNKLSGKKLIVFATGAAPGRPDDIARVIDANFSAEQLRKIQFFYLRSGFDYNKISMIDKLLMNYFKLQLKRKEKRTGQLDPDERGMLNSYVKPVNFSRKAHLAELLKYARGEARQG